MSLFNMLYRIMICTQVSQHTTIILYYLGTVIRVPTDTGKPGKMRQLFPVREKSGNFEKLSKSQGKVREF